MISTHTTEWVNPKLSGEPNQLYLFLGHFKTNPLERGWLREVYLGENLAHVLSELLLSTMVYFALTKR